MDANTQIANDLHLLTAPIRFLFRCVLALLFLLAAPLLSRSFHSCAFPLTPTATSRCSRWICGTGSVRERILADDGRRSSRCLSRPQEGRIFEANHFKGFGLMFIGFIGSLGAEALFLFYLFPIPRYTENTVG